MALFDSDLMLNHLRQALNDQLVREFAWSPF